MTSPEPMPESPLLTLNLPLAETLMLLERGQALRHDQRLARLLQLARLRYAACVEDVNFRAKHGVERSRLL